MIKRFVGQFRVVGENGELKTARAYETRIPTTTLEDLYPQSEKGLPIIQLDSGESLSAPDKDGLMRTPSGKIYKFVK